MSIQNALFQIHVDKLHLWFWESAFYTQIKYLVMWTSSWYSTKHRILNTKWKEFFQIQENEAIGGSGIGVDDILSVMIEQKVPKVEILTIVLTQNHPLMILHKYSLEGSHCGRCYWSWQRISHHYQFSMIRLIRFRDFGRVLLILYSIFYVLCYRGQVSGVDLFSKKKENFSRAWGV